MRILIEVSGGVVEDIGIESGGGKPVIFVADYDNLQVGDRFDTIGMMPHPLLSPDKMDARLREIAEKYNSIAPGDDRDQT